MSKKSSSITKNFIKNNWKFLLGTLVLPIFLAYINFSKPDIIPTGDVKVRAKQGIVDRQFTKNKNYLTITQKFQNNGLKTGRIDKAKVFPVGFHKELDVEVIRFDKTRLEWLDEKTIITEAKIDFRLLKQETLFKARIVYYDQNGYEIYAPTVTVNTSYNPPKQ